MTLYELGKEARRTSIMNGFSPPTIEDWDGDLHKIPAFLALIHSEASEALEAFRRGDREGFSEELADVLIRVIDLAYGLEIDLADAVEIKMAKNRHRPHKHGGKRL